MTLEEEELLLTCKRAMHRLIEGSWIFFLSFHVHWLGMDGIDSNIMGYLQEKMSRYI
jgi:hypothetical protein